MRRFIRGESPDFLRNKWKIWGERYKKNRQRKPGFTFQWPTFNKKRINILLGPILSDLTDDHCSFCDNFPIRSKESSIDHFRPKSIPPYFELVCQWENLYFCCHSCQQSKGEQYNEFLLRPDDIHYSFEAFFIYSYNSHRIDPNPTLSDDLKRKAETTIRVFGLNDIGHKAARRISLERFESKKLLGAPIEINDFPYRFTLFL